MDIISGSGVILNYSFERFKKDIVEGDCCFICGASRESKEFNDEHVIPDWIIKKYNLTKRPIFLPNDTDYKYNQYKIPCCINCNDALGKRYETPISKLFHKGISAVSEYLHNNGNELFFEWLALIFLKTHLKDMKLNYHQNKKLGEGKIGDTHDWEEFHYLHAFVRSFHTGVKVDPNNYGTLKIYPSLYPNYEYCDSQLGMGMMIKLGEISFLCMFKDCGIVEHILRMQYFTSLELMLRPLAVNSPQLRERFMEAIYHNEQLVKKPTFEFNCENPDDLHLTANKPSLIEVKPDNEVLYKEICRRVFSDYVKKEAIPIEVYEKLLVRQFSFFSDDVTVKYTGNTN